MTICKECKGDMNMMVDLTVVMPAKYESKLTKKIMASKEFKVYGASWGRATYICSKCGYTTK